MQRLLAVTITVGVLALVAIAPAQAAADPDRILATPSTACRILQDYGASGHATFGACMGNLNKDMAAFRYPSEDVPPVPLTLEQRCAGFEQEFLTYPFAFVEGEGWPFPVLTAQNRQQCRTTLYVYHALAG